MSLFLYKPHVEGPDGNITSPDIIVDRVYVNNELVPVNHLSHECWQQVGVQDKALAAFGLMALGGGALILPALMLDSGTIIMARKAWRLNNLDAHTGQVTLNCTTLLDAGLPANMIEFAGGNGDALPRGYLLFKTIPGDTRVAELHDPVLARSLSHRVVLESVDTDRWGDSRPRPRYAVGPTKKEVQHFI